jgi:hypothetical protein
MWRMLVPLHLSVTRTFSCAPRVRAWWVIRSTADGAGAPSRNVEFRAYFAEGTSPVPSGLGTAYASRALLAVPRIEVKQALSSHMLATHTSPGF